MTYVEDLAAAERALQAAQDDLRKLDAEISNQKAAIDASYRPERETRRGAINEADQRVREIKAGTPDHPWTGQKVTATFRTGLLGVVEIRRLDTKFGASRSWALPSLGEAFVRLLKTDGKPGVRHAVFGRAGRWVRVDEP